MTRAALLTATAATLVAAAAALPAPALAGGGLPGGSYKLSCFDAAISPTNPWVLRAYCKIKHPTKQVNVDPTSINFHYCKDNSIWNDDGHLRCDFDQAKKDADLFAAAAPAFRSAAVIVLGREAKDDEIKGWMQLAATPAYGQGDAIASRSLQFTDAALMLRQWLRTTASTGQIYATIDAAWRHVYDGKWPNGTVHLQYYKKVKAGQAWYSTIVLDQQKAKAAGATGL